MSAEAMVTTLKLLKLYGMAGAVDALATQASPAFQQAVTVMDSVQTAAANLFSWLGGA